MMQVPRLWQRTCLEGVVVCGVLLGGMGLGVGQAIAQGATEVSVADRDEAVLAYETGVLLHREGEFEAAVEQYFEAIGLDPSLRTAYAALTDAQLAAGRSRLLAAVRAADEGDLDAARRHAQRAFELDGGHAEIRAAAQAFGAPNGSLSAQQRAAYEHGKALAVDQNWRLAHEQFADVVEQAPMFLPARAALHDAAHAVTQANTLTNRGIGLIEQRRLGPAVEALTEAVALWPYHPDAAEALDQAQAGAQRAQALAQQAQASAPGDGDWEAALGLAEESLAIDRSNAIARRAQRVALRSGAQERIDAGDGRLALGNYTTARAHYRAALDHVSNYPAARRGMAQTYLAQGATLERRDRHGAALLAYLAGHEHDRSAMTQSLRSAERRVLAGTGLSVAFDVPEYTPSLGVNSETLATELASVRLPAYLARGDADDAGYLVQVRILDTDIALRRTRSTQSTFASSTGYATGYTQWEKRGTVRARVTVSDRATGDVVWQTTADRWASYSDRQQYVVGRTWQRSYWTLPTDDAVAARLTDDLVAEVWPQARAALVLARAQVLHSQAEAGEAEDADTALEHRVAAAVLVGQVERREGAAALRDLMQAFDQE